MSQTESVAAARAFARNLNILLKYVRLYGARHQRTAAQLDATWNELSAASRKESGLLIGVAEETLLIDGAAVDGLGERSFAAMLKAAGISSIHFSPTITRAEFDACALAFASGKPAQALQQLRQAATSAVKINEVKFVAQDETQMRATELMAQALGDKAGEMKEWLRDPEKLVQLIAAAEGSRSGPRPSLQAPPAPAPGDVMLGTGDLVRLQEPEMQKVFRILARLGELDTGDSPTPVASEQFLADTPEACTLLRRAVLSLPAIAGEPAGDSLSSLAEKLAIRFARQQFERGEVKVDAVHQLMERMAKEIESLRQVLNAREDRMQRAGIVVESYAEVLDRQFWASMPASAKKAVLMSKEAWCIPPRNIRTYVTELLQQRDRELAVRVLRNYARQLANADLEARKRTAAGLSELGDLFGEVDAELLTGALQTVGLRLQCESVLEQQTLLTAAYVRLTQEASQRNQYRALSQSLNILERLQEWRPRTATEVRPRITVENRLGEFIADAVQQQSFPPDLIELLRQTPAASAEHIALRFSKSERCSERDRYVELLRAAGPGIEECLVGAVRSGNAEELARAIGPVSRVRPDIVQQELSRRIETLSRPQQDVIVRQLGAAGAAQRGGWLAGVLNLLDPLVAPEALDEISLAPGDVSPDLLLELAAGQGLASDKPYLRIKAVEALGRLQEATAVPLLVELVQRGSLFDLGRSRELRVAAAQALAMIDPERIGSLLAQGFNASELRVGALPRMDSEWVRARRYPRIQPAKNLPVLAITDRGRFSVEVCSLNLGGGLLSLDRRLPRRGDAVLEWPGGLVRVRSHVVLRELSSGNVAFEVVNINLDGRGRIRKLLADSVAHAAAVTPSSVATHIGA